MAPPKKPPNLARNEARHLGCKYFYDDIPCANGHKTAKFVSTGRCVECRQKDAKRHYKRNKTAIDKKVSSVRKTTATIESRSACFRKTDARRKYAEVQADRVTQTVVDIQKYIKKLQAVTDHSSMCNKKDVEALIQELEGRVVGNFMKCYTCPFCNANHRKEGTRVFKRRSWYLRHICVGRTKNLEIAEKLQADYIARGETFI